MMASITSFQSWSIALFCRWVFILLILNAPGSQAVNSTLAGAGKLYTFFINNKTAGIITNLLIDYTGVNATITVNQTTIPSNDTFKWHLHLQSIVGDDCDSAGSVHYDPTTQNKGTGQYNPVPGNLDTYEAGDLSGKWGTFNSTTNGKVWVLNDPTLPGANFTQVKSLVLHSVTRNNIKVACANITEFSQTKSSASSLTSQSWLFATILAVFLFAF